MSSPASGIVSTPTIYGKVDYGPTFGAVYRPLNTKRKITVAGSVTILPFDVIVVVRQTIPAAVTVLLPDLKLWMAQPYGGFDLTLKNGNAGFDMTIMPFGTQTIDKLAQLIIGDSQGVGAVILTPLNDMTGWDTL